MKEYIRYIIDNAKSIHHYNCKRCNNMLNYFILRGDDYECIIHKDSYQAHDYTDCWWVECYVIQLRIKGEVLSDTIEDSTDWLSYHYLKKHLTIDARDELELSDHVLRDKFNIKLQDESEYNKEVNR